MRILLATLALLIAAAPAGAISRYNAWNMSCAEAKGTIRAEGAVDPQLPFDLQSVDPALWPLRCRPAILLRRASSPRSPTSRRPTPNPVRCGNAICSISTMISKCWRRRRPLTEPRLFGCHALERERLLGRGRRTDLHAFQRQQLFLGRRAARGREAADLAAGGQDAVARHDQRHRIVAERLAGLARLAGMAGGFRQPAIGRGLAEVELARRLVDRPTELVDAVEVDGDRRRNRPLRPRRSA